MRYSYQKTPDSFYTKQSYIFIDGNYGRKVGFLVKNLLKDKEKTLSRKLG